MTDIVVLMTHDCVFVGIVSPRVKMWRGRAGDVCFVIKEHSRMYDVMLPDGSVGDAEKDFTQNARYLPSRR